MATSDQPLHLDSSDLFSPKVEDFLKEREFLARSIPEVPPQPWYRRLLYSSYFYLSIAGGIGAMLGWITLEPFFDDNQLGRGGMNIVALLLFPTVAGCLGTFIGAVEGVMCRNLQRACISAVVGLGVGFGGGLIAIVAGGMIYGIMSAVAISMMKGPVPEGRFIPTGFPLLILMMGRGAAWSVAAIPAGIGQGIALRERKVVLNGLLGAVLGGLIGGVLFDPISIAFTSADGKATLSRGVGFTVIGISVGLFIGLVEQWTKTAWLLMRAGPLAGKQFVVYRNPTVLGSSPKADIYLFKDEAIEPRHALIHNRGGRYELEDCQTPDGTYVNGIPIQKQMLQPGDQIVLGKTVLEFSIKEAK